MLKKLERMIFILFKKLIASLIICTSLTVAPAGLYQELEQTTIGDSVWSITASAANVNVKKPQISLRNSFADKIEINLKNLAQYKSNTLFNVYIGNSKVLSNIKYKSIKNNNGHINIFHNGKVNLKANTTYNIRITAIYGKKSSGYSNSVKVKTPSAAYYCIKTGSPIYTLKKSKMTKTSKVDSLINVKGILSSDKGIAVAGKNAKTYKGTYIKILEGKYKGKYIKCSDNKASRLSVSEYKRRVVSAYAASMHGGRYVYGGSSYRATDCSGLTMLAYKKIGVNLPHSSTAQSRIGKSVSRSNMKAGDILILNGGGHVAMYIGNNKIVHAMNSYDGIKVQHVSNLKYYSVNSIRRII